MQQLLNCLLPTFATGYGYVRERAR